MRKRPPSGHESHGLRRRVVELPRFLVRCSHGNMNSALSCAHAVEGRDLAQVKLEPGMQFCRSMSTALGIVLAVAAMPAAADWRNFFVPTNPAPSGDVLIPDTLLDQELPQDDPIDLPDPITELNDLPPLDLGDEPLPSDPQCWSSLNWTRPHRLPRCRNPALSLCSRSRCSRWGSAWRTEGNVKSAPTGKVCSLSPPYRGVAFRPPRASA